MGSGKPGRYSIGRGERRAVTIRGLTPAAGGPPKEERDNGAKHRGP